MKLYDIIRNAYSHITILTHARVQRFDATEVDIHAIRSTCHTASSIILLIVVLQFSDCLIKLLAKGNLEKTWKKSWIKALKLMLRPLLFG